MLKKFEILYKNATLNGKIEGIKLKINAISDSAIEKYLKCRQGTLLFFVLRLFVALRFVADIISYWPNNIKHARVCHIKCISTSSKPYGRHSTNNMFTHIHRLQVK